MQASNGLGDGTRGPLDLNRSKVSLLSSAPSEACFALMQPNFARMHEMFGPLGLGSLQPSTVSEVSKGGWRTEEAGAKKSFGVC